MPDPSDAQLTHVLYSLDAGHGRGGLIDESRIHSIHEACADLTHRCAQDPEDGDGDQQPDHRVGDGPAKCDTTRTEQYRETGETIRSRVQSIGDESRTPDLAPDPDPVPGNELVAGEANQCRTGDEPQVPHIPRVVETGDCFVGGEHTRQGDHGDDEQTAEVLGSSVSVGVTLGGRSTGQRKGNQQRYCRERVGHVVQGVSEKSNRTGRNDNAGLDCRSESEPGQADDQHAPAGCVSLQGVVDLLGSIVGMDPE